MFLLKTKGHCGKVSFRIREENITFVKGIQGVP
jgi:hypothetical protein